MDRTQIISALLDINTKELPFELRVEGDYIVATYRWMDGRFFDIGEVTNDIKVFEYKVLLSDNGVYFDKENIQNISCKYDVNIIKQAIKEVLSAYSLTYGGSIQQTPIKKSNTKKIIAIVICFLFIFVIGFIGIILFTFSVVDKNSDKLICTSSKGSITIYFNGDKIQGVASSNIPYERNIEDSKSRNMGQKEYMNAYSTWFTEYTTDGTCSIEYKK